MRTWPHGRTSPLRGRPRAGQFPTPSTRLNLEALEDRLVPATVTPSVSVAIGPAGKEFIEVVSADGTLTQYSSTGAHPLLGGVSSASTAISNTHLQVIDVVFQTGVLVQYDSRGGVHLLANGVKDASVAFSPS